MSKRVFAAGLGIALAWLGSGVRADQILTAVDQATIEAIPSSGPPNVIEPPGFARPDMAALNGNGIEFRGVTEFDLSGALTAFDSITLQLNGGSEIPAGAFKLAAFVGDGSVTLADFDRLDTDLGFLPAGQGTLVIDVSAFVQAAIVAGEQFVGFVIFKPSVNGPGIAFRELSTLRFATAGAVPEPASLAMLALGGLGVTALRRRGRGRVA